MMKASMQYHETKPTKSNIVGGGLLQRCKAFFRPHKIQKSDPSVFDATTFHFFHGCGDSNTDSLERCSISGSSSSTTSSYDGDGVIIPSTLEMSKASPFKMVEETVLSQPPRRHVYDSYIDVVPPRLNVKRTSIKNTLDDTIMKSPYMLVSPARTESTKSNSLSTSSVYTWKSSSTVNSCNTQGGACCVDDYSQCIDDDDDDDDDEIEQYTTLNSQGSPLANPHSQPSLIDTIMDDILNNENRAGFKSSTSQHVTFLPAATDECASLYSKNTTASILSTATPFCVFNDDDNNTVVSYKVIHKPITATDHYDDVESTTDFDVFPTNCNDSENVIPTPHIAIPSGKRGLRPLTPVNNSEVWNSNWKEMNDDDTITTYDTILSGRIKNNQPHEEIVFVRSKRRIYYNGSPLSMMTDNVMESVVPIFPWNAYLHTLTDKTKSRRSDKVSYTLVEI